MGEVCIPNTPKRQEKWGNSASSRSTCSWSLEYQNCILLYACGSTGNRSQLGWDMKICSFQEDSCSFQTKGTEAQNRQMARTMTIPFTNKRNFTLYCCTYMCKFYFEQNSFSCHISGIPCQNVQIFCVTGQVRKAKCARPKGQIGQLLPPYSKNTKPTQISTWLLDRAHKKSSCWMNQL